MIIPLIIIFIVSAAFALIEPYLNKRDKIIVYVLLCLCMILLEATKSVGSTPDSHAYERMFYGKDILTVLTAEPTFQYLSNLLYEWGYTVAALFAVYAVLSVTIKGFVLYRMSTMPMLTLCIYISFLYILQDLVQIRAGAAVSFILCAIYFMTQNKRIMTCIMVAIATSFHFSAATAFLLVFLNDKPLDKTWKIVLYSVIPIGLIMYVLKFNIVAIIPSFAGGEKLEIYKNQADSGFLDGVTLFDPILWIRCLIYILSLHYCDFLKKNEPHITLYIRIMGISLAIFFFFLYTNRILAYRLSELFSIVEPIIAVNLIYFAKPVWVGRGILVTVNTFSLLWCIFMLQYVS